MARTERSAVAAFGGPDYSQVEMQQASQAQGILRLVPAEGALHPLGDSVTAIRTIWYGQNHATKAAFAAAVASGNLSPPIQPGVATSISWDVPEKPIEKIHIAVCWAGATVAGVGNGVAQKPAAAAAEVEANVLELTWPGFRIFNVVLSPQGPDADNFILLHAIGYGVPL